MTLISKPQHSSFQLFLCSILLFSCMGSTVAKVTEDDSENIGTFIGENTLTKKEYYGASYIGSQPGDATITDNNSLILTGKHAVLNNKYELNIGQLGDGNSLSLLKGASSISDSTILGYHNANSNTVIVSGIGSALNTTGTLSIGGANSTDNSLEISKGGAVKSADTILGSESSTSSGNSIEVTGSGSSLISSNSLVVGQLGANNSVKIEKGASAQSDTTIIGQEEMALNNSMRVTGQDSSLTTKSLIVGQSGEGKVTLDKKGNITADEMIIAENSGSKGTVNIGRKSHHDNAGTLNATTIAFGDGTAAVNFNQADDFQLTSVLTGGTDVTIHQRGPGSTTFTQRNDYIGKTIIDGGTLALSNVATLGNDTNTTTIKTATLEMGGTTQTQKSVKMEGDAIVQNGAFHDTAVEASGDNNLLAASLQGKSSFVNKSGNNQLAGTTNTYTGGTTITGGILTVAADSKLGSQNGKTTINNGQLDLSGGTQTQQSVALNNAIIKNGNFSAARFTSTGGLNDVSASLNDDGANPASVINKAGTTTLSGENSYSGTTDINGGTVVGASQHAFGTSTVNLAGGNLKLQTNVSASSVNWNSTQSILELSSGDACLKTKNLQIEDKDQTHYLDVNVLDNDIHTAIKTKNPGDLSGTQFALSNRDSDSYILAQNNKGTKETYQLTSDGTLDVGKNDQVVDSYETHNAVFHPGSCLTVKRGACFNVDQDFTGDEASTIHYVAGSTKDEPGINVAGHAKLNHEKVEMSFADGGAIGNKYAILSASSVEGEFGEVLMPEHLRARKTCEGDPVLFVTVAPESYAQMAQNQNQTNVALALNSFIPATSGDQLVVSTALDGLTAAEYPNAFNQISPALYSSFTTMAFNNVNAQNNQLIQRLGNIRVAGVGFDTTGFNESPLLNDDKNPNTGKKDILIPSVDNHWGVFVDGNGIFANVNINNQLPGYSYESGGVTMGADYKWNNNFSSGVYAGYQGAQSKQSGGNFICDNGSRFGVFGAYQQGGIFANALLGGDTHSYQVNRTIQFPGINRTATSAPTAQELDSMIATGYDIKRGNFTFGPITSLQYTYLGVQPFTETGAQSLNLSVASQNANSLLYNIGSHAFYTWQANKNILVVPQVNMGWQHEFLQNPYAINATLAGGGGVFNYTATAPTRDALYTGVGATVNFSKKYEASFFYNAFAANPSLMSQNFFVSLGMRF